MNTLEEIKEKIEEIRNSDFKISDFGFCGKNYKVSNILRSALLCSSAIGMCENITKEEKSKLHEELKEIMKNKLRELNPSFSEEILDNMINAYNRGYVIFPMDIFVIDDAVFHREGVFADFGDIYKIKTFMFDQMNYYNVFKYDFTDDDFDLFTIMNTEPLTNEDRINTTKFICDSINSIYHGNITKPKYELNAEKSLNEYDSIVSGEISGVNVYLNMKFSDIARNLKAKKDCNLKLCIQDGENITLYYIHQSFKGNEPGIWNVTKTNNKVWKLTEAVLERENQIIAVEKVREEIKHAEEILNSWNAFWWESYEDCFLPQEYFDSVIDYFKLSDEEKAEYSKVDSHTATNKYNGIPLKRFMFGGKYSCDVSKINWYGIMTNNSFRKLDFYNNGDIYLQKTSRKKQTETHPTKISYNANYNVLSNDFEITITLDKASKSISKKDNLIISLSNNILAEKYNNIEIIRDYNSERKVIRIVKKHEKTDKRNNASVVFEAIFEKDNSLKMGSVVIETHKSNGKVNGTFRFDVSRKEGISANFYSRKGIKIDLTSTPSLLNKANTLLLPAPNTQSDGDIIVSDFANGAQNAIAKNLTEKVINFDNSDFNMESVYQAENKIIEMIKCIKGELPLLGLIERIDEYLRLIEMEKKQEITDSPKILTLN